MTQTEKPSKETLDGWHDDPKNWKLSIFYFNRTDKRIFPPKRMQGMGWTVNFANPWSILATIGIVGFILLIIRYLR